MTMKKLLSLALLAATACGGEDLPPLISPLVDQTAIVGVEMLMTVRGADPEGESLAFSFSSEDGSIDERARFDTSGDAALFRFVPMASDVGVHTFDFTVSDGSNDTTETITVVVELSSKGSSPTFVQPLGTGTTLDLRESDCVHVPITVDDPDTAGVTLGMAAPIEGSELSQLGELNGAWSWCPSEAQTAATDRYTVALSADDGDNPIVTKDYLIVLQGGLDDSCEGQTPAVVHDPADIFNAAPYTIVVGIADDLGLKNEPLLYYTTTDPGDSPDLSTMTQITMQLDSGDMQSGNWTATMPNPVAGLGAGAVATLFYVVVAQDADAEGCSHWGQAPAVGTFRSTFVHPDEEPPPPTCVDDSFEDDDSSASANLVDLNVGTYTAESRSICSLDDDWYEVYMYNGETLYASLDFTQLAADEDIDILVYKDGVHLTGCSEQESWLCDPSNGQSGSANESLAWPIVETGTYNIVVRGWAGSENVYDICVGLNSSSCP
jgi:hypothetical protein